MAIGCQRCPLWGRDTGGLLEEGPVYSFIGTGMLVARQINASLLTVATAEEKGWQWHGTIGAEARLSVDY